VALTVILEYVCLFICGHASALEKEKKSECIRGACRRAGVYSATYDGNSLCIWSHPLRNEVQATSSRWSAAILRQQDKKALLPVRLDVTIIRDKVMFFGDARLPAADRPLSLT
jgi:hypothetical protein